MGRGRFKERSHLLLLCLFGTYSGLGVASRDEEGKSGPEPALGSPPAAPGPPRRAAGCVRGELRTFAPLPPPPLHGPAVPPLSPCFVSWPYNKLQALPSREPPNRWRDRSPTRRNFQRGSEPPRPRAPLWCRAPGNSSTTDAAVFGFRWKGKDCLTWRHVLPFFPSLKQHKGSGLSRRETFEIK